MKNYTNTMNNGQKYNIVGISKFGGMTFESIEIEPCYKLSQYGMGETINCQCSVCKAKGESHEVIKARLDKMYKS